LSKSVDWRVTRLAGRLLIRRVVRRVSLLEPGVGTEQDDVGPPDPRVLYFASTVTTVVWRAYSHIPFPLLHMRLVLAALVFRLAGL
jgi:hypothetical protein